MRAFAFALLLLVPVTGCLPASWSARRPVVPPPTPAPASAGRGIVVVRFHDATLSGVAGDLEAALRDAAPLFGVPLATSSLTSRPGRVLSPAWCAGTARAVKARWLVTGQILGFVKEGQDRATLATEFRVHDGPTGRLLWVDQAISTGSVRAPAPMLRSLVHQTWERARGRSDLPVGGFAGSGPIPSPSR